MLLGRLFSHRLREFPRNFSAEFAKIREIRGKELNVSELMSEVQQEFSIDTDTCPTAGIGERSSGCRDELPVVTARVEGKL